MASTDIHPPHFSQEQLRALGDFASIMDADPKVSGGMIEHCYEQGWILSGFDWPTWSQTDEAAELQHDPQSLRQASSFQLAKLLTFLIRQDRFVEGALETARRSGLLSRVLERAVELAHEP